MVTLPETLPETLPIPIKVMASIRDVARHVGCSTSTVSRVINARDGVDPETRRKVLETVELLGYRPNLIAQGLRVRRGKLIGLVLPEGSAHVFSVIIQCTLEAAYQRGYNIIIVNSHEDPDLEERYIQDLLRRNINGIIFSRVSDESRVVSRIVDEKIPMVVIDRALEHEHVSNVVLDNYKAGYLAGRHLTALGHRRVACVTGPMKIALCRERLKGFRDALAEAATTLTVDCIFEGGFQFQSGLEAVQTLLERRTGCTAIWAMNDMMALGVMKGLYRNRLKVPDDMSVMGMDDHEFGSMTAPSLTSIHYPFNELAERAVEIVARQIESPGTGAETVVLEPGLTIRHSTARVKEPVT